MKPFLLLSLLCLVGCGRAEKPGTPDIVVGVAPVGHHWEERQVVIVTTRGKYSGAASAVWGNCSWAQIYAPMTIESFVEFLKTNKDEKDFHTETQRRLVHDDWEDVKP